MFPLILTGMIIGGILESLVSTVSIRRNIPRFGVYKPHGKLHQVYKG